MSSAMVGLKLSPTDFNLIIHCLKEKKEALEAEAKEITKRRDPQRNKDLRNVGVVIHNLDRLLNELA